MEKIASFAERLNEQLEEKHFTLAELGRLAHVDRSLMTKYKRGTNYPKIDTIRRLAAVLYVNPEWLVGTYKHAVSGELERAADIINLTFERLRAAPGC